MSFTIWYNTNIIISSGISVFLSVSQWRAARISQTVLSHHLTLLILSLFCRIGLFIPLKMRWRTVSVTHSAQLILTDSALPSIIQSYDNMTQGPTRDPSHPDALWLMLNINCVSGCLIGFYNDNTHYKKHQTHILRKVLSYTFSSFQYISWKMATISIKLSKQKSHFHRLET